VTGENSDETSARSAQAPVPDRKRRRQRRTRPLTFLEFLQGVLSDDDMTRNLRRLVFTAATAIASIVGIVCVGLVLAHVQLTLGIAGISAATTVLGMAARSFVMGKRAKRDLIDRSADQEDPDTAPSDDGAR
jgi:hypothetical protein